MPERKKERKREKEEENKTEEIQETSKKANRIFKKKMSTLLKSNTFNTLCVQYIKDMSCSLKYLFSKCFWGSIMITGYMKLRVLK